MDWGMKGTGGCRASGKAGKCLRVGKINAAMHAVGPVAAGAAGVDTAVDAMFGGVSSFKCEVKGRAVVRYAKFAVGPWDKATVAADSARSNGVKGNGRRDTAGASVMETLMIVCAGRLSHTSEPWASTGTGDGPSDVGVGGMGVGP